MTNAPTKTDTNTSLMVYGLPFVAQLPHTYISWETVRSRMSTPPGQGGHGVGRIAAQPERIIAHNH